jgi:hypothetical protein
MFNGVSACSSKQNITNVTTEQDLVIGADRINHTHNWGLVSLQGWIDDVRIYNDLPTTYCAILTKIDLVRNYNA